MVLAATLAYMGEGNKQEVAEDGGEAVGQRTDSTYISGTPRSGVWQKPDRQGGRGCAVHALPDGRASATAICDPDLGVPLI